MIGILGGTFDPIHYGHLRPAQEAQRALALEEIRVVPAANPPHRQPPVANAAQRLRMTELAVAGFPGFRVDDREVRRGGPSYTVRTLESLRVEMGPRPLCLLLGMDAFLDIETWHQWTRLPELAHLVVMQRPGWAFPDPLPAWATPRFSRDARELTGQAAGRVYFQTTAPQDISATRLRAAIGRGESVEGRLPPAVWDYIRANRLYSV
ncbi:MAG: nicotinate-nucleotide adenylyltransferase [Gammaproteobacteria bacterium]|nr:nicotinate-nucleotide adenylyltransferase [Gammaproteobacteria bacterium]